MRHRDSFGITVPQMRNKNLPPECDCPGCIANRAGKTIPEPDPFTKRKIQAYFRKTYDAVFAEMLADAGGQFGKLMRQAMQSGLSVQESLEAVRMHFRAQIKAWENFLEIQPVMVTEVDFKELLKKSTGEPHDV